MVSSALRIVVFVILFAHVSWPATAQTAATETCALLVTEAQFELADLRELEHHAPIESKAYQAILELLEPLWEARLTERLRYMTAKHDRDRARLLVDQSAIVADQAAAKLEVLTLDCFSPAADPGDALGRYKTLGCDLVRKGMDIAAVDVVYRKEVLESTDELRRQELATAQELIDAKYYLNLARAQLRSRTKRLSGCSQPKPAH